LRYVSGIDWPKLFAHKPVQHDAHAFDQAQEDRAHHRAPHHVLRTAPSCHDRSRRRPTHDGVPGVFLLPEVSEGTVEGGEAEAPGGELAAQDGRALLHAHHSAERSS